MKIEKGSYRLLLLLAMAFVFLCLPAQIHAKSFPKVKYKASEKSYYLYTSSTRKARRPGLHQIRKQKANRHTFNGIYYVSDKGKIGTSSTIRYVPATTDIEGKTYAKGYYYFGKNGRLNTDQCTHKLNLTYRGKKYKGYYCFAGLNGRLIRKKGLAFVGSACYYVTDTDGQCLTGSKKKVKGIAYSFKANGKGKRTNTKLKSLNSRLTSMSKSYGGYWSIYIKRLDNNDSLTINNTSGFAASLIKAFTMASAYEQIELGNLKETAAVKSLLNSMITISSNESYNEMVMRQAADHSFAKGRSIVNDYLKRNGYRKTEVHGTYGSLSISDGKQNCTSVADCGMLLESIYRGTCVSKASSRKMLNLLLAQQRRGKIPAGLPSGTKVANKTGENAYSEHDIAIVYSPKCTYILCVMSFNSYNAPNKIAAISRTVYQHFN